MEKGGIPPQILSRVIFCCLMALGSTKKFNMAYKCYCDFSCPWQLAVFLWTVNTMTSTGVSVQIQGAGLFYVAVNTFMGDTCCADENYPLHLKFNGKRFLCGEHLKVHIAALESKATSHILRDIYFLTKDQLESGQALLQIKPQIIGYPNSLIPTIDGMLWSSEQRYLTDLRIMLRRFKDDHFFAQSCLEIYFETDQDVLIFCECSKNLLWAIGTDYNTISHSTQLEDLPGRNMRGWLLTFVTHLHTELLWVVYKEKKKNKSKPKDQWEDLTQVETVFKLAWLATCEHFQVKVLDRMKETSSFFTGCKAMLKLFKDYEGLICDPRFWLHAQQGSFHPDRHSINFLTQEWKTLIQQCYAIHHTSLASPCTSKVSSSVASSSPSSSSSASG